jgi:hypothetical protein
MDTVIAAVPAITIEEVLDTLATTRSRLPREAIEWALDNWEVAAPDFLALLEGTASGEEESERTEAILFFALHLFAEKRETRAFPALCRLLQDPETPDLLLGDAITETLTGIIISTFNGDADALKSVIEAPCADEFVRGSALNALSYLAHSGVVPAVDVRVYLQHLFETMQPRSANFIWSALAGVVARMGYADMTRLVARAFRLGFVERIVMDMDDFKQDLQKVLDDPTGTAGFVSDRIVPFTDTIGTFSTWYGFSDQRREDDRRRAERALFDDAPSTPRANRDPSPSVGRNDPCPCGSGKKYKKCCLAA